MFKVPSRQSSVYKTIFMQCSSSLLDLFIYYSRSMPKRRKIKANRAKQTMVMTADTNSVGQKPMRGNKVGKTRNIGKVGITYQKVYQA